MRTVYSPRQVMALKQSELDRFAGVCVAVSEVSDRWWGGGGGMPVESEGLRGDICRGATRAGDPHRMADEHITIEWHPGDTFTVLVGQPVFLLACDEHGDHRNEPGRLCIVDFLRKIPAITDSEAA